MPGANRFKAAFLRKASITGAIVGNILLVLGLSILAGGLRHTVQKFNATAASMGATLLALAAIGLIVPTLYYYSYRFTTGISPEELAKVESLSEEIAGILFVIYLLSLVFSLRTHRHLFSGPEEQVKHEMEREVPEWSRTAALAILVAATTGIAAMSELLVGSVEQAAEVLGMNRLFTGVIVVALVGSAAEQSTAVWMALAFYHLPTVGL